MFGSRAVVLPSRSTACSERTYQSSGLCVSEAARRLLCSGPAVSSGTARSVSPRRERREGSTDAEAGMPSAEASGAICVQRLDDSRNSAIHIKYRISLRSSSLREPRYPLLRVVWVGEAPLSKRHSGFSFRGCLVCGVRFRPASEPAPRDLVPVFTDGEVGQRLGQEQAPGRAHWGPAPREHNDKVGR